MSWTQDRLSRAVPMLLVLALLPASSWASNSSGYHWARSSNPLTLELGDNVSSVYDPHLQIAAVDWSVPSVLDTVVAPGGTRPKLCSPNSGRVEVCNAFYGNTGWLALRQIWTSGTHITQATIKLNDTYLTVAPYNTSQTRQHLICQNVGSVLGLTAQSPANGSCMGSGLDEHPNAHDYEELEAVYSHLDLPLTAGLPLSVQQVDLRSPAEWGRQVGASRDGRVALYGVDFGAGVKVFTLVTWAE